jgi:membrane fusion protein (multidrug efflux system)
VNQDATTAAQKTETKTNGVARRRWIALLALLVVTVGGVLGYWRYAEIYPSTDNAYTGADIVRVAPLVTGPVTYVYVADDEKVAKDDPLFDIDSTPYEAALRGARAQFDAAASAAGTAGDDLKNAAETLESKRSDLGDAITKYREAKAAQSKGQEPSQELTDALKGWHEALSAYEDAHNAFGEAQNKKITVTTPTVKLRGAAAQLDKATEDWVRTHVVSPGSGWLSNVRIRPGAVVQAGTPVFALIEDDKWWVDANFKETDLARIKPGQPATITLDMYPDLKLDGTVESISAGSGATFSVLPPENATGNWVKVTQRFPVRIKITSPPDPNKPLRVGASATVTANGAGASRLKIGKRRPNGRQCLCRPLCRLSSSSARRFRSSLPWCSRRSSKCWISRSSTWRCPTCSGPSAPRRIRSPGCSPLTSSPPPSSCR